MFGIYTAILLVIFPQVMADAIEGTSPAAKSKTYVVNLEFCRSCLSKEEAGSKDSYKEVNTFAELKHDPRADLPAAFTICSSAMTTYGWTKLLFNILGKDGNSWLQPFLGISSLKTNLYHVKWLKVKLPPVFAHQWVRSCMAIDSESGLLQWVVDGVLVHNATLELLRNNSANKPKDLTGKIVLGAFQSGSSKKWQDTWLSNQVANLNIFSSILTIKEMHENTKGDKCGSEGDYLAWRDMQWNLNDKARVEYVATDEVCKSHPALNLYPAAFRMQSCKNFCQKIGSRSPRTVTLQQWENLEKNLEGLRKPWNIWLALKASETEGEWRDSCDGKVVNFSLPWQLGQPNGGGDCVSLRTLLGVSQYFCSTNAICMCERTPVPSLRHRGLCAKSAVKEILYQPMNNVTHLERMTLVGFKKQIEFNPKSSSWHLTDKESNVTATTKAPHNTFTLGRHNWTIRGDKGCSEEGREYTTELKMSGCLEGSFTCDDGQCVSMDERCNQVANCRDESDEDNCQILVLKKNYNKNVPPIISSHPYVNVSVSIDLLRLVDINEPDYSIEIQFEIMLKWKENRATYNKNNNNNTNKNNNTNNNNNNNNNNNKNNNNNNNNNQQPTTNNNNNNNKNMGLDVCPPNQNHQDSTPDLVTIMAATRRPTFAFGDRIPK